MWSLAAWRREPDEGPRNMPMKGGEEEEERLGKAQTWRQIPFKWVSPKLARHLFADLNDRALFSRLY